MKASGHKILIDFGTKLNECQINLYLHIKVGWPQNVVNPNESPLFFVFKVIIVVTKIRKQTKTSGDNFP